MRVCYHFYVHGKVQGVYYRAYTKQQAMALQLTGWVKNSTTGGVEIVACGQPRNMVLFYKYLKQGPPLAMVTRINKSKCDSKTFDQFVIKT